MALQVEQTSLIAETQLSTGGLQVEQTSIIFEIPAQSIFPAVEQLYIKSYALNNGDLHTLTLDANGILRDENVITRPKVLLPLTPGVIAGSRAFSTTLDDVEYICFSNLLNGTDIPRQYNVHPQALASGNYTLDRVSQVGPGAPPSFTANQTPTGSPASITSWAGTGSGASAIVTFQAINTFVAGEVVTLSGFAVSTFFNGVVASVLGTGLSGTQFEIAFSGFSGGSDTGLATPQFTYPISSISQPTLQNDPDAPGQFQDILWSVGPGNAAQKGAVVTVYYAKVAHPDNILINTFNSGIPTYVLISGALFGNGTQLVTGVGVGTPPGAGSQRVYFTFQANAINLWHGGPGPGVYQQTLATVITQAAIPNLSVGQIINISGVTGSPPLTNWNANWSVVQVLAAGVYTISQTAMSSGGTATYSWTWAGTGPATAPIAGQLVTVTGCTNGNGIFNVTDALISTVTGGPNSGTFTIAGFTSGAIVAGAELNGQAQTFGNSFQIDPGATVAAGGTGTIYGNYNGSSPPATVLLTGASPIASGTRQAVCFFETRSGFFTPASPPVTFTTSAVSSSIIAGNIPIGPPNVVRRWISFTPAGQNGIPGPNFFIIPQPVSFTVNGQKSLYTSTFVDDNITTTASFTFTDTVLLSGEEIDVQGNNLFNEIELGASAWNVAYAGRMFYGLEQNKVLNFNNLTFDGGYLPASGGGNTLPLGWFYDNIINSNSNGTLVASSVFGDAYYVLNSTGSQQTNFGMITQPAYQDPYNVPIILPNTLYSVRVYASIPSGNTTGSLIVDLTQSNQGLASGTGTATGYGITYGTFTLPFTSMSTTPNIYSGTLLTSPFTTSVPTSLVLRLWAQNIANNADVKVERIEIYPTYQPLNATNVRVSYIDNFEAFDAVTGNLGLGTFNNQPVYGAAVLHDQLYFLQPSFMQSTQDVPGVEPSGPGGGWPLHEVANRVGACGLYAYDYGEEWILTACRNGLFGFNGGQPMRIDFQQKELWELINWNAGSAIQVVNDLENRRILVAVPLPTPNQWLPLAPSNPNPTSPNVILMWNYQELNSFNDLVSGHALHTTMFGTLAAVDMRLKMSIWQIPTPYMDLVMQSDLLTLSLSVCGASATGRIYQLSSSQLSDDGVAVNGFYTTYGFVNSAKASQNPLLGFHRKRYQLIQSLVQGSGNMTITTYPNYILTPKTLVFNPYAYTVPAFPLVATPIDDISKPLNISGNRVFVSYQTNAVGAAFTLSKMIMVGILDPFTSINPTAG